MTPASSRGGGIVRPINYQKLYSALIQNLAQTLVKNIPLSNFYGKMETFLTCRRLARYLSKSVLDEDNTKFFEVAALNAVKKTLATRLSMADLELLFSELPFILPLKYPVVEEIRKICIDIIPNLSPVCRANDWWREFAEFDYLLNMLKTFDSYKKNN